MVAHGVPLTTTVNGRTPGWGVTVMDGELACTTALWAPATEAIPRPPAISNSSTETISTVRRIHMTDTRLSLSKWSIGFRDAKIQGFSDQGEQPWGN